MKKVLLSAVVAGFVGFCMTGCPEPAEKGDATEVEAEGSGTEAAETTEGEGAETEATETEGSGTE